MFRQLTIALLVATASLPLSTAQMHGGSARGTRGIGPHHGTRRFARGIFPSSPYFYGSPYFYSDYAPIEPDIFQNDVPSDAATPAKNVPAQVVVVRPAAADDSLPRTRPQPLLIERQGDRYVRYEGAQTESRVTSAHPDYAAPAIAPSTGQNGRAESPAPVVLVYRDGHAEEIADYAIADGVIYVRGNYWQNGYWTKQVPLAALEPQATMKANQQRGAKFMLPSAPNVVIASF